MSTNRLAPTLPTGTVYCTTRTGKRVHVASAGSSVTYCGVWMREDSRRRVVDNVEPAHVCESCAHSARLALDVEPARGPFVPEAVEVAEPTAPTLEVGATVVHTYYGKCTIKSLHADLGNGVRQLKVVPEGQHGGRWATSDDLVA
jgi:hypothetical protein